MYNIKNSLLKTGLLADNDYLSKYIDLVESNKTTLDEKFVTQSHHIIPRCYFKSEHKKIDNTDNNLVNLKFCDHILAHYYLYKASKDQSFATKNAKAVLKMSGCDKSILDDDRLLKSLKVLQESYELKRNYISTKSHKIKKDFSEGKYEKALTEWKKNKNL